MRLKVELGPETLSLLRSAVRLTGQLLDRLTRNDDYEASKDIRLVHTSFYVEESNILLTGVMEAMTVRLETDQRVTATLQGLDRRGRPASVESIRVESSDSGVATVTQDPSDPTKITVRSRQSFGETIIKVTADKNLDPNAEEDIILVDTVIVAAAEATVLGINWGTPEDVTEEPVAVDETGTTTTPAPPEPAPAETAPVETGDTPAPPTSETEPEV
jgi:hypothetical protein